MHSLIVLALCPVFIGISDARAAHRQNQLQIRDAIPEAAKGIHVWLNHVLGRDVFHRQSNSNDVCIEDAYYNFAHNVSQGGENFCQAFYGYPDPTVVVDYTPTSTETIITTEYVTVTSTSRYTPVTTTTVLGKRDAAPQITPAVRYRDYSQVEVAQVFNMFRRQLAASNGSSSSAPSNDSLSSSFSSACSCQTYTGTSTITQTYTDAATVVTIYGFDPDTTTVVTTRTAAVSVVTVTAHPSSSTASTNSTASASMTGGATTSSGATSSSSAPASTPTAPPFTCPEDNNTTVSQMVGNQRFDYLVECDTEILNPTLFGEMYYDTFSECVAACSVTDANFTSPLCQGVSYFMYPNKEGYNCLLKTGANMTVAAIGVDSAILQRIAIGISSNQPLGTSTESAPFSQETPTGDPGQMSSSVSVVMANSTTSMPIITPGPPMPQSGMLANAGSTYCSTYVSNGSTYSSGTVYSTYYSSNGSWYSSYYTAYTLGWSSATTVYGASETGTSESSSNNTSYGQLNGNDGSYSIITTSNSTQNYGNGTVGGMVVTQNETYASNGTEIYSTASTSYYTYSYATSTSGSGSGGSGSGSNATFSTQTVVYSSGGTVYSSGYAASGAVATGVPSTSATTIYNSAGTAYSSGYAASGAIGGASGGSGGAGSGAASGTTTSISVTTIVNSAGTAHSSGYAAFGASISGGTAYSSGYAASGPIASGGTAYSSGYAASGAVVTGGTAYSSGYAASGMIGGSVTAPTRSMNSTVIVASGGTAYSSGYAASGALSGTAGQGGTAASGVITPTPSGGFSNTGAPRVGTESTTFTPTIIETISTGGYGSPSGISASSTMSVGSNSSNPGPSGSPPLFPFSNTGVPRSGSFSSTSIIVVIATGPSPYPSQNGSAVPSGTMPVATGPPPYPSFSDSGLPRGPGSPTSTPLGTSASFPISSGSPIPAYNTTVPTATGIPSALSGYPPFDNSGLPRSGSYSTSSGTHMSGTVPLDMPPIGTAPTTTPLGTAYYTSSPSSGFPPFSDSGLPRSGYPPSTGTSPITSMSSYALVPTGTSTPVSCPDGIMGTTTVFVTTTLLGCYQQCPPNGGGYGYGGPQSFGPPVMNGPLQSVGSG